MAAEGWPGDAPGFIAGLAIAGGALEQVLTRALHGPPIAAVWLRVWPAGKVALFRRPRRR